jgi:serine/threonine-protein kinase RsbW
MPPASPWKVPQNGDAEKLIEFSIPSRLELLGVLDQLVQAIAIQLEFEQEAIDDIATSLIEAATNAIQHGHQHDASKPVWFRFLLREQGLDAWVADLGDGFDLDAVLSADPTRPEDLYRSRGRGIFIMRAMMDSVDFDIQEGRGVTVHLTKTRVTSTA